MPFNSKASFYDELFGTKLAAVSIDKMLDKPSELKHLDKMYPSMFDSKGTKPNQSTSRRTSSNSKSGDGDVFEFALPAASHPKRQQNIDRELYKLAESLFCVSCDSEQEKTASGMPQISMPGCSSMPVPLKAPAAASKGPPAVSTLRGTQDPQAKIGDVITGRTQQPTQPGGNSPSQNPINYYGPLSMSGQVNGNASFGGAGMASKMASKSIMDAVVQPEGDTMGFGLQQLANAKAESDRGNYPAKHDILRKLIKKTPADWAIDSSDGARLGVTHIPSGYRFHMPQTAVPDVIKNAMSAAEIDQLAGEAVEPISKAQADAGNYRKGHIKLHGLDVSIENPRGSTRRGVAKDGKKWESTLTAHYGYIRGTIGADDDHVDIFIGPHPEVKTIHVIDQIDPLTGKFDEHKVVAGVKHKTHAKELYLENYAPGWKGLSGLHSLHVDDFKNWLAAGKTRKPIAKVASATCPGCGNAFKKDEPRPDVTMCEICERYGKPSKEASVTWREMRKQAGLSLGKLFGNIGKGLVKAGPKVTSTATNALNTAGRVAIAPANFAAKAVKNEIGGLGRDLRTAVALPGNAVATAKQMYNQPPTLKMPTMQSVRQAVTGGLPGQPIQPVRESLTAAGKVWNPQTPILGRAVRYGTAGALGSAGYSMASDAYTAIQDVKTMADKTLEQLVAHNVPVAKAEEISNLVREQSGYLARNYIWPEWLGGTPPTAPLDKGISAFAKDQLAQRARYAVYPKTSPTAVRATDAVTGLSSAAARWLPYGVRRWVGQPNPPKVSEGLMKYVLPHIMAGDTESPVLRQGLQNVKEKVRE